MTAWGPLFVNIGATILGSITLGSFWIPRLVVRIADVSVAVVNGIGFCSLVLVIIFGVVCVIGVGWVWTTCPYHPCSEPIDFLAKAHPVTLKVKNHCETLQYWSSEDVALVGLEVRAVYLGVDVVELGVGLLVLADEDFASEAVLVIF